MTISVHEIKEKITFHFISFIALALLTAPKVVLSKEVPAYSGGFRTSNGTTGTLIPAVVNDEILKVSWTIYSIAPSQSNGNWLYNVELFKRKRAHLVLKNNSTSTEVRMTLPADRIVNLGSKMKALGKDFSVSIELIEAVFDKKTCLASANKMPNAPIALCLSKPSPQYLTIDGTVKVYTQKQQLPQAPNANIPKPNNTAISPEEKERGKASRLRR